MKKLLVVMMVVSLLAFAGSAFAATFDLEETLESLGLDEDDLAGHIYELEEDSAGHADDLYGTGAYAWAKAYTEAKSEASEVVSTISSLLANVDQAKLPTGAQYITADMLGAAVTDSAKLGALADITANSKVDLVCAIFQLTVDPAALGGTDDNPVILMIPIGPLSFEEDAKEVTIWNFATDTGVPLAKSFLYYDDGTTLQKIESNPYAANGKDGYIGLAIGAVGAVADVDIYPGATVENEKTDEERHLSSNGGGCAMGTSAMALAVLGVFMAMRKK